MISMDITTKHENFLLNKESDSAPPMGFGDDSEVAPPSDAGTVTNQLSTSGFAESGSMFFFTLLTFPMFRRK